MAWRGWRGTDTTGTGTCTCTCSVCGPSRSPLGSAETRSNTLRILHRWLRARARQRRHQTPRGATKAHDITKMIQACLVHHVTCAHGNPHIPPSTSTIVHLSSCALLRMHVRVYVAKHPCSERRRNEAAEELHGASAQVHWLAVVLGEVQTERTTFSHRGALVLLSAEEQLLVGCRFKQHARL